MEIRPARSEDLAAILALLELCRLPTAGVPQHLDTFFVAVEGGRVVGSAGLEVHGQVALLRSVATEPAHRGQGVARRLCAEALREAARRGARSCFLLTETAADYFARYFAFQRVPRSAADPRLLASEEFQGACPEGAHLMARTLTVIE